MGNVWCLHIGAQWSEACGARFNTSHIGWVDCVCLLNSGGSRLCLRPSVVIVVARFRWLPVEQRRNLLTRIEHGTLCTTRGSWRSRRHAGNMAQNKYVACFIDALQRFFCKTN